MTKVPLKMIKGVGVSSPENGQVLKYNSSTGLWENQNIGFKLWTGSVTVGSSGTWSVNFSAAGFTSVPKVFAQAHGNSSTGERNFASVSTITTTSASGHSNSSITIGLLLATVNQNSASGTVIDIMAIGS